ncbi:MAG: methyl-accepting chemotaxis protein, partial [Thermodesulfobacterium sp.]|nr:methyl-accepting chemotaxis protein [Thermodesulfobacterium sp.]
SLSIRTKILILLGVTFIGYLIFFFLQAIYVKDTMLREKKIMLVNIVESAISVANYYHQLSKQGILAEEEAKKKALESIKNMRYEGTNYWWINDGTLPIPIMVMHPTVPALDGKPLDNPKFFCAYQMQAGLEGKVIETDGKKNLFAAGVEMANQAKGGFVWYKWPKPLPGGGVTKEEYPKMSYVAKFEPWGWYVGSGVYIDDVEKAFWEAIKREIVTTVLVIGAIFISIIFLGVYSMQSICKPIEGLQGILKKIGEGELKVEFDTQRKDEVGKMMLALREALEGMKRALTQAKDVSLALAGSSQELSSIVNQVKSSVSMQAEKATQIASSAEEMSTTIVDIAKNTNEISSAGVETARIAGEGRVMTERTAEEIRVIEDAAGKVLEVVSELEGRARQIGNIVVLIKDIADQTNLLALNATIEAARAGEHGRSFAVVAGEIRKLAEKANEASDEIAGMIREVQGGTEAAKKAIEETVEKVGRGVELSVKASSILREIEGKAEDLRMRIQQIASATEQMSAVVDQIVSDISGISQSAKEVSKAIEDTARTAETVAKMGTELKSVIEKFKF